jgi:hypothetical protein
MTPYLNIVLLPYILYLEDSATTQTTQNLHIPLQATCHHPPVVWDLVVPPTQSYGRSCSSKPGMTISARRRSDPIRFCLSRRCRPCSYASFSHLASASPHTGCWDGRSLDFRLKNPYHSIDALLERETTLPVLETNEQLLLHQTGSGIAIPENLVLVTAVKMQAKTSHLLDGLETSTLQVTATQTTLLECLNCSEWPTWSLDSCQDQPDQC